MAEQSRGDDLDALDASDAERAEAEAALADAKAAEARARAARLRLEARAGVTSTAEKSPPRRRTGKWLWRALGAVGAVVLCALLGLGGWLFVQHRDAEQANAHVAEATAVAKQGVINMMSLDFNNAQASVQRVLDGSTGKFKEEFQGQSDMMVKALQQSKVVTEVTVNSAAVQSMTADSAVVLVAAQSQASNATDGRREPQKFRIVVTLQREGGQYKIAQVDFA